MTKQNSSNSKSKERTQRLASSTAATKAARTSAAAAAADGAAVPSARKTSISEHPFRLIRMTWEGLYVALSRVKFRNDIRLLLRNGDRSTFEYIFGLKRNKEIQSFFDGYKPHPLGDHLDTNHACSMQMKWDGRQAAINAGYLIQNSKGIT